MPATNISISAPGITDPFSVASEEGYGRLIGTCVVEGTATTLSLSDSVTVGIGYGSNTTIFVGYVKKIERMRPEGTVMVTLHDILHRATDFFIVSDDPETPFQRNNISTEDLVSDLLGLASISSFNAPSPPPFTWGTNEDGARFNLQSVADAIQFIAQVTGFTIYADDAGTVQMVERKPYVDGDATVKTFTTGASGEIIAISHNTSSDKIRNVVKVYGKTPLTAQASAASPFLVVDQSIAIAHELLDTQALCDNTASVNLTLLNRLTEAIELEIIGDPDIRARNIYAVTESFTGLTDKQFFAYRVSHQLDSDGGYRTLITGTP